MRMKIEDNIIYKDKDIYVCHKPAGILSQADKSFGENMVSALMFLSKKEGDREPFVAPVNRLDRPVEGIVIYARNQRAAAELSKQINEGAVDKFYYALVLTKSEFAEGKTAPGHRHELCVGEEALLEDFLVKDSKTNMSRIVEPSFVQKNRDLRGSSAPKKAVLEYCVMKLDKGAALLRIKLHTGRHHQIRVQLAGAGLPIMGDSKYGVKVSGVSGNNYSIGLCSYRTEFVHPFTKGKLSFEIKPQNPMFMGWF